MTDVENLAIADLKHGQVLDFGSITLSEDEIMDYARLFDPLPFHIDKKIAEQSPFKGLISSGPQVFNTMYIRKWIPLFGNTVLCGLEINNWKFMAPIYANQTTTCKVTIIYLRKNEEKKHVVITWRYEFFGPEGEMAQTAEVTVMHKL
ncbi:MAG TPA: MaoC/PaaZ C-terminal domain-containing protein [Bacteroidia bacterium]|nr:MaoC/PaaZ C-terminal domain-containing protein [Bacteroidia bacterium]